MASSDKKTALVFGASGVSGWAVVNQLLAYPTPTTFGRVIGLTHRPLDIKDSYWPQDDDRLECYSGVNLREDLETVKQQLREKVPRIDEVTHVYYCAYSNATAYSLDVMEIRDINVKMTGNAVRAIDEICVNLQFWVLQTGTNHYGTAVFRFEDKIPLDLPLRESHPRVPSPWGDEIFYYSQVDTIKEVQKGKSWKWCDVRPDGISGFAPGVSAMTWLEPVALYLALYRYLNGPNAEVPFIGTSANYIHTNTDSAADIIARSEIYLSVVKPDEANGEGFNTADYDTPVSWIQRWPVLASYFGLKGVGLAEPRDTWYPVDKWWDEHQDDYKRMCAEYGLVERKIPPETWIFTLVAGFNLLKRNRQVSLDKIRAVGYNEELPIGGGQFKVMDRLAGAKRLPPKEEMQKGFEGL